MKSRPPPTDHGRPAPAFASRSGRRPAAGNQPVPTLADTNPSLTRLSTTGCRNVSTPDGLKAPGPGNEVEAKHRKKPVDKLPR